LEEASVVAGPMMRKAVAAVEAAVEAVEAAVGAVEAAVGAVAVAQMKKRSKRPSIRSPKRRANTSAGTDFQLSRPNSSA
jgi:ATP-dependent exoDNAse (exonuclease V) alpha subunit